MKRSAVAFFFAYLLTCYSALTSAKVIVTVDRNDADHATPKFEFKNVQAPAKNNAAINAKFTLVSGHADTNGADLDALHDGVLSTNADQPEANFFFVAGSEGGRILVTLAEPTDVREVRSYSWHTDSRAAQVFKLYTADGSGKGFNDKPADGVDPETCGWTLTAKVDTRPANGVAGGQHAVSISNSDGTLGKCRYLLFVISATEFDDDFGNTFLSEINIIDAHQLLNDVGAPTSKPGVKLVQIEGGKYTATIDTTETPDLTQWVDAQLAPVVAEWYPKLVKMLPSPGYAAPTHFSITFRQDKPGVADTQGTRINCAAAFFRNELNKQAKGAILHEMVHVVQQYGSFRAVHPHADQNPGCLVEGIPDYIRWYLYEPKSGGAVITRAGLPKANYDGSYRITANFLNWAIKKYDKNLIQEMNDAMRNGSYSPDLWKKYTNNSVDDLNQQWKADLANTVK